MIASINPYDMKGLAHQEFGNYKIVERIEGVVFSTTFKAVHKFTGKFHAIKIAYSSNEEVITQLREIYTFFSKNTIQLNHPNIVTLQDFFIEVKEGITYFVLVSEYIGAQMLDDFLTSHPNLSDKAKMTIAKQVGEALKYAHNFTYHNKFNYEVKGIKHGDLQPWNILVREDLSTYITDFEILNIKRLFNFVGQIDPEQKGLLEIHSIKDNFGKNAVYYAPEQKTQNIISIKSDIYHYGRILFFLFSGKYLKKLFPDGAWTKKDIRQALPVRSFIQDRKLSTVIYKATQSNQQERYDTITQIIQAISPSYSIPKSYNTTLLSTIGTFLLMIAAFVFYQKDTPPIGFISSGINTSKGTKRIVTPLRKESISQMDHGDFHALLIGNEKYQHLQDLTNPIDDIQLIQEILKEEYAFKEENIKTIQNGTRAAIIEGLEQLYATQEKDKILILYAGHGKVDDSKKGFWMPIDATNESMTNWISNEAIKKLMRDIPARHILLVSDACFSGSILRRRNPEPSYATSIHKKSRIALTSGSLESVPDHSVFIRYLAKYLQESPDSIITASELFSYLQEPVKVNSPDQNDPGYGPIKDSGHEGGDFFFLRNTENDHSEID